MIDRMLRPAQAAAFLGITVRTLQRWADSGKIPLAYRTPGDARRFRENDLERWRAAAAEQVASNQKTAAEINTALGNGARYTPTFGKVRPGRKRRYFGSLEVHDNGVFYAYWYNANLKRVQGKSLHTRDPGEARRLFLEHQAAGPPGTRGGANAPMTVGLCLDEYYAEHVEKNVVDTDRQADAIAHLKAFFGPTKPLAEIDIPASRAYARARRCGLIGGGSRRPDRRGSDSTIRRELVVLKAAAHHAKRWKRIDVVPSFELPVERPGERVKWLTKEQISTALENASGRLRDFIELAYYLGARRRSVERLLKSQVDLKHGTIDLHPPGTRVTKKRKPKVPIFPSIRPTVERLMAEGTSPYLLGAPRSAYREFVSLMDILGIDAHPHMLRHSRATHLLQDGESLYKVAKLLGDTVKTVESVYGHYDVEFLQTTSTLES